MGRKNASSSAAIRKPLSLKQPRASQADFDKGKVHDKLAKLVDKENVPSQVNQLELSKELHAKVAKGSNTEVCSVVDRSELRKKVEAAVALHMAGREKATLQVDVPVAPESSQPIEAIKRSKSGTSAGTIMSMILVALVLLLSAARVVVVHQELLPVSHTISQGLTATVPPAMFSSGVDELFVPAVFDADQLAPEPSGVDSASEYVQVQHEVINQQPTDGNKQELPTMPAPSSDFKPSSDVEQPVVSAAVLPVALARPKVGAAHQLQLALSSVRRMFGPLRAIVQKLQQVSQEWARRTMLAFRFAVDRFR